MSEGIKRNRRTLKKRIRRITYLCILITIVLFSSIVVYIGAQAFKAEAGFVSDYFSSYIAQSMSSESFLKQMEVTDLKELNAGSPAVREWLKNVKRNGNSKNIQFEKSALPMRDSRDNSLKTDGKTILPPPPDSGLLNTFNPFNSDDFLFVKILVDHRVIYTDDQYDEMSPFNTLGKAVENSHPDQFIRKVIDNFNTESICDVIGPGGVVIAVVSTKINYGFILGIGTVFIGGVIIAGLLALIVGNLVTKLLTIPVTVPICNLDEKIKVIASGDNASTMNAQIVLKKPLREIESLADSTNVIMNKMKEYNELLYAQNEELEAQNEELAGSKKQIQEAQALLVQNESMASIGQLTAAITHEINTPLGAINSNVQMCDMLLSTLEEVAAVKEDGDLSELASQMKEANSISLMACGRVSQIIKSLKNFSKVDQAEFQETDINEGIRSVLVLTSNLWKRRITLHEDYGALPPVKCFPGMLNQVFMNLVVNAIQAISENGDIYIKTWFDSEKVYIRVKDTGCGIREDHIARIFDTGFTTKASVSGMGLGLSISRNIINKHGGEIKVSSTVGEGTEFIVCIPLNAGQQDKSALDGQA